MVVIIDTGGTDRNSGPYGRTTRTRGMSPYDTRTNPMSPSGWSFTPNRTNPQPYGTSTTPSRTVPYGTIPNYRYPRFGVEDVRDPNGLTTRRVGVDIEQNRAAGTDYANRAAQTTRDAVSSPGFNPVWGPPGSRTSSRLPQKKRYLPGTAGLTNAQRSALNADRQRADEMYYGPEGRLAQLVQQGLGLNLIPYDEEVHDEAFIGFAQDFAPGSYVIEQVGEDYRKRTLKYRRGMERLNPQAAMGWSPGKVTDWRAQARFLSQYIDFGSNSPMGTDPGVWTEGDAAAMEWMMAAANETGRDVEQVMADYLQAAESGTLDAELMGGSGPGGTGMESQAREVTRTDTTFSLTDLDDARTLIATQMRRLMGRDPSDREVSAFLSALNTKEKATPSSIVVTNAEYNERGDLVSQETRRTQGDEIDRASMARSAALADGGMAEARKFHLARAQDVLAQMVGI